MIVKGNAYCNAAFWSKHLMRADINEAVRIEEIRGLTSRNVRDALYEMQTVAGGAGVKNGFYIVSLNTLADEPLSPEQWRWAADRLEQELGLEGQARFIVEHTKDGSDGEARTHWHVCWSRIDVDRMHAISDSHNYRKHEIAARAIEREFGLTPVESVLIRDKEAVERPERRPDSFESFRAMDTKLDPQAMREQLTALWHECDSGLAFKAALEDAGYILAKGDRRDFCVIDQAGDEHSLARRISGAKAAEIRARMGDLARDSLPTVAEARRMALEAQAGGGGTSVRTEPEEALAPPAAPGAGDLRAAVEAEEAGQIGPASEWTPGIERELAGRFGDWEPEAGDRKANWEPESEDRKEKWQPETGDRTAGWEPETQDRKASWQAEPGQGQGQGERVTPWGRAWRAVSDRARAFGELLHEVWHDETAGMSEQERGFAARLLDAGRELWSGLRGRDATKVAEGVEDAAGLAGEPGADKGNAEPKSWVERVRERASQIWRNERGAMPDFETGDALWEAMAEEGDDAGDTPQAEPSDPDNREPDEGGLDGPDFD